MHPKKETPSQLAGIKGRLVLVASGACLALVGVGRLRLGELVVRHWTGPPFYSAGLVAVGGIVILMAFIPLQWINKAAQTHRAPAKGHSENTTNRSH